MNPTFGRLRFRLVLALGSLIATTCFAGTALDTVRDCATTASPTLYGLKDLDAVCPELRAALGTLGLDQMLYERWQDKLNVHALHDVIDLSERYSGHPWPGPPDTSAVPGILQTLGDEQAPPVVWWWHAFKNWIKQWLDHSDSSIAKWLKHLFENVLDTTHVSPAFLQAFVYIVTILTALAALVVIVRELRAAGISGRFRRVRSALNSAQNSFEPSPADREGSADEITPAGLLRALVKRLLQTGRLSTERSLTHRELIARTSFDSDGQKSAFADVARTAETILYGSKPAAPEVLETVTRQGRELLRQLSQTAGTP
ncbi:MAG: hypothetical protein ABI356_06425 [Steroidobacteraceae bacterium]